MQIFASEVFPTNARGVGVRLGGGGRTSGHCRHRSADPLDPDRLRPHTVFVCLAIVLLIAAASVTQLGPED